MTLRVLRGQQVGPDLVPDLIDSGVGRSKLSEQRPH